jgi:hypothetical protein
MMSQLPPVMHVPAGMPGDDGGVAATLRLLALELGGHPPGLAGGRGPADRCDADPRHAGVVAPAGGRRVAARVARPGGGRRDERDPPAARAATAARSARAHDDRGHRYAPGIVIDGIELRDRVWLDREVT